MTIGVYKVSNDKALEVLIELVQPALDYAGTHSVEDVETGIRARRYQGWIVAEGEPLGGLVTRIAHHPNGRKVLEVWLMGGHGFLDWSDTIIAELERFARYQNCEAVVAHARPGLARWLKRHHQWQPVAEIVELRIAA